MDKLVRSIKFPFVFNKERLLLDTNKVLKRKWVDHYNSNDYNGKWTSIALMSNGGKSGNIVALSNSAEEFMPTDALDFCDYFKEILDGFLFEKIAVRLLNLGSGAEVKPHRDHCLGYEDGVFRLHIPIITNPEVEFILDDQRLTMNPGECWYFNANFLHSVKNGGDKDRIHLVIDGVRNEWTDQLFFREASINEFVKTVPAIDADQKKLIIAELVKMNLPIANELIKNLEK
ncbi:aspartyl/asparaginyl beta-hydroxylase domain-containing protein [Flavobacterium ranwuense]|uniref:Aspartyl/asparaginyl beta-hydroxylase domain-containing protein n=1 Tax=Flavobacterium ranwuense TaxID=2541725 RepID=A0ABY2DPI4_9FLAO|nr:aspartyl/asparaginyl beta-hydroxylase domain-containing protein [Flavobacterium ranwuense]TDE28231.1 aspartyl/asparaginyl beta-hydroxylase domain-containing protein [Flavobacterium ranwuense]